MSFHFYRKPMIASATALANLLKKYECYGENLVYPENEEELYETAIANTTLITSALTRIRTAVENVQEKVNKMEDQYSNAKKSDQKDLISELHEIDKESQYSQHLASAEEFIHTLEGQLTKAKVNLGRAQRKLKLPPSRDSIENASVQSTNGLNWSQGT
ncbi:hypothetical protein GCK32_009461 [Trichostrongylus colubriformis]|uniref:Uncharacterized protein n=1 Tax=Trichostrongylus colubriformis TaxID=6319 RepID=A0AAN8F5E6_TRICO